LIVKHQKLERVTSPWGIDYDKSSDLLVVSTENGESIAIYKRHAHR
jgi:frataxin-like iron-binding protein CyaY